MKSGYRVLSRGLPQRIGGFSNFKLQKLWNLVVPPKMKIFMWRVMHDSLPTLENLRRRCVDVFSTFRYVDCRWNLGTTVYWFVPSQEDVGL